MGDQRDGRADLTPDLEQPLLELRAGDPVECPERLVEQHRRLAEQHRAQERGAVAHAARELPRPCRLETAEPEALEQRAGALTSGGPADARELQPDRHVVDRPPPRQQPVVLRHEGARAEPVLVRAAVDQDLAGGRGLESGEDLEQRALAATARADHGDELAGLGAQIDAVECEERLDTFAGEGLGEAANLQQRTGASRRGRHHDVSVSAGGRQRMTACSSAAMSPNRISVRTAVTITAPKTNSVLKYWLAVRM